MEFDKKIYEFISRMGGDATLRDGIVTVTLPGGTRWNFTEPKQVDERGKVLSEIDTESFNTASRAILVLAVQQGQIHVVKDRYEIHRSPVTLEQATALLKGATETKTGG